MFQFITSIASACLLLYMATIVTGRFAWMIRLPLVAAVVANAILAAQHFPASLS